MCANIAATQTRNSSEWMTPWWIVQLLQERFNNGEVFDLDPAATVESGKGHHFFDKETDGLVQAWYGSVFVNPPYNNVGAWVKKAHDEALAGNANVTMLVAARTDTRWWWDYVRKGYVYFLKGRIKFIDPTNEVATSAPFPSAVVYFSKKLSWSGTAYWEMPKPVVKTNR